MIFPDDLIALAKEQLGDQESSNRSAISRAYYSCYHSIHAAAIKSFGYKRYTGGSTHKHLYLYLLNHDDENVKVLGNLLKDLSYDRVDADYKLHGTIHKNRATLVVAKASSIIEAVKKVRK